MFCWCERGIREEAESQVPLGYWTDMQIFKGNATTNLPILFSSHLTQLKLCHIVSMTTAQVLLCYYWMHFSFLFIGRELTT